MVQGATPSNSSRFTSTDMGLLHMIALDLNNLDDAQLAWLETDLRAANAVRHKTPWIMVMSHFPLAHSAVDEHWNHSLAHYLSGEERTGECLTTTCVHLSARLSALAQMRWYSTA